MNKIVIVLFILEHNMFDTDFCPEGEHKVRPYIGFGYRLDFDYYDIPKKLQPLTFNEGYSLRHQLVYN